MLDGVFVGVAGGAAGHHGHCEHGFTEEAETSCNALANEHYVDVEYLCEVDSDGALYLRYAWKYISCLKLQSDRAERNISARVLRPNPNDIKYALGCQVLVHRRLDHFPSCHDHKAIRHEAATVVYALGIQIILN